MLKNNLKGKTKMIITKWLLSVSITVLFINQIVIILEKGSAVTKNGITMIDFRLYADPKIF